MNKTIKLISWNVNGIRAIAKKNFLEFLAEIDADIVCLQETRATYDQIPPALKEIPGYTAYFVSAERGGYSGVAVYSKLKPQSVKIGLDIPCFDKEGRIIIANFGEWQLFNCYFPNGGASLERLEYKMAFYEATLAYAKEHPKLIICGDVNTAHQEKDLARPKENQQVSGFLPMERAWIDKLLSVGYVDTFRLFNQDGNNYSWWDMKTRARDRNIGWRIDYFFAGPEVKEKVKYAFILPQILGSDHCPVGIKLSI